MPYTSTSELPKAQTDQYSGHQKSAFRKAFNNCYNTGGGESKCFAIAHSAAQNAPRKKKPRAR